MEKMTTRLQMRISSERIKLESCDTTYWKAREKSFQTVTRLFNFSFVKTIYSVEQMFVIESSNLFSSQREWVPPSLIIKRYSGRNQAQPNSIQNESLYREVTSWIGATPSKCVRKSAGMGKYSKAGKNEHFSPEYSET